MPPAPPHSRQALPSRASALLRSWPGLMLLGSLPCLLFALYTQHAWEDWFITYRAGKNLALGNGLVFEPGQVVHTFTSPLNVLLPAALSWFLGNQNDLAVLWLYRVICAAFLGGTVVLLHRLAVTQRFDRRARLFLIAFFLVDGKILDFSINGQEAAFLVFFLILMLNALLEQRTLWLGIAWAGLLWSRPDSFIYIGSVASVFLAASLRRDRDSLQELARLLGRAAVIALLLYGPWLAWTTFYYGTPLPHTIVAKGLGRSYPPTLLKNLLLFPWKSLVNDTSVQTLFMPPYYYYGGWPNWMAWVSRGLAWVAATAWLYPGVARLARACSLGVFIGLYYIMYIVPFPQPWYFPSIQILAMVTLASLLSCGLERFSTRENMRRTISGLALLVLMVWLSATSMLGWQLRVRQPVIEDGHRRQIGLWLKQQAAGRRDTVFVECLGYIGFYSNLKMYDFPGNASPEVVAARRLVGDDWGSVIRALQPDWLVLRPHEANEAHLKDNALLTRDYRQVTVFDRSEELKRYSFLPGRSYLEFDQTFLIFQHQPPRH